MVDHRLLVRLEQIMHRRDLQRRDIHVPHQFAALDRVARRVDDDPGNDGRAAFRGFHRRRDQVAVFLVVQRVPLAGRSAGGHAMAAGADQPVDLRRHLLRSISPSLRNGVVIGGITPVGRTFMIDPFCVPRQHPIPLFDGHFLEWRVRHDGRAGERLPNQRSWRSRPP